MSRKAHRLHSSALEYFMAVVEEGSFRSAARKLRIAPSAVNRHVLLLEQELGFELFERTPAKLKLSAAGQIVRRHCNDTLRSFERASEALDALRGIHSGIVRIVSSESFAAEFVPMLCSEFSRQYPGVDLRVSVSSSEEVFEMMEADDFDVGFAFGAEETRHATVVASFDLPIGAVVGRLHPLAERRSVRIAECFEHPVVFPAANLSVRKKLDEASDLLVKKTVAGIEASSPRLMVGIARLQRHVAFLTPLGMDGDLSQGDLVFIPLEDPDLMPDRCVLLTSIGAAERFAARRFLEWAAVELRRVLASRTKRVDHDDLLPVFRTRG